MACVGHTDTQAGLTLLDAVDAEGALVRVALRVDEACVVGAGGETGLAADALVVVTSTTLPGSCTWLAPVGQQLTQGGWSQWLQRSERMVSRRSGIVPSRRW